MQGAGARRARASLPPLFGPPVFDPPVFDHVRILPSGRRILGELRPARQTGRTVGSPVLSGLVTGSLTRNFLSGANSLRPDRPMGMLMRTALLLPLTLLAPAPAFAANAVALDNSVFVRSEEHKSELQSLMRISY